MTRRRTFKIIIGKGYKRVTLHRVLVSKLLWDLERFDIGDLTAFFENQLYLENLAERDPSFRKSYRRDLESISNYLKAFRIRTVEDLPKLANSLQKYIKVALANFHYPKRNYKNQLKRYKQFVEYRPLYNSEGIPTSQLPPVKYIGKGYTDQGTAKIPSYDGSPSWQDIATRRKYSDE